MTRPEIVCSGDYATWATALAASTGYYLPEFVERTRLAMLQVKRGEAAYERDSVLFDRVSHPFPLLAALLLAALENDRHLTVFDFGGGLGTSYFQCRGALGPLRRLRWLIVDQPSHVRIGHEEFESDELRFFPTAEALLASHSPQLLLLSGVLPCVPDPYGVLEALLDVALPYVVVDRTFFLQRDVDRLTVQHGPEPIYPGSYPAWFLSETRLLTALADCGYDTLWDFPGFDSVGPEDEPAYTKGFVFRRRSDA